MRKIYILCFLLQIFLLNLKAQNNAAYELKQDAIQLAARLLEKNEIVEEIPTTLIDSLCSILTKIKNSAVKQSNIITDFQMHAHPRVDVYNMRFFADASTHWVKEYVLNQNNTPEPLAYLFYSYEGITLELIQVSDLYCEFNLHSEIPMNMNNFGRQISNLPGVEMVMLGGNDTRKNINNTDIKLERINNAWIVSYYYKTIGQSADYYWQFSIEDNGDINFIGEFGDTPPPTYKSSAFMDWDNY